MQPGAEVVGSGSVNQAEPMPRSDEQCQTEQPANRAEHQPGQDESCQDDRRGPVDQAEHPRADNNTHPVRQPTTIPVAVARQVEVPLITIREPKLTFTTQEQRGQAEQRSRDQAEQRGSMPAKQTDPNRPGREHTAGCAHRWSQVLGLWSESDKMIEEMIIQAKGGPSAKYMKDGTDIKRMEKRWKAKPTIDNPKAKILETNSNMKNWG